jgi:hypothetical protein
MITPPYSSAETMERSLAYTIAAFDSAAELDFDLTMEQRNFMTDEKAKLESMLDKLLNAHQALVSHMLKMSTKLQARVLVGDAVLDRGLRTGKARMKLELKFSMTDGADFVFGRDVTNLVNAELRSEPALVQESVSRFAHVPDFNGKDELKKDLEKRALQQIKALADRDDGELARASLSSTVVRLIADCSEALYRLEKRLLDKFPRERNYVKSFFLDAAPKQKPAQEKVPPIN